MKIETGKTNILERRVVPDQEIISQNPTKANLGLIKAQLHQIPTEEAPKFDYRSHSFAEAIKHLARDIIAAGGAGGMAAASVKAAYNTIMHHKIDKQDLIKTAALGGGGAAASQLIMDAYDTILHNGKS